MIMEVYEKIKKDLFVALMILICLQTAWAYLPIGRDNSDGQSRSGLQVHVDYLTGCEYFSAPNGGVTPRLDAAGKQICGGQVP